MSRGKELAKNTIIITIGKVSTQFISFLLLPLYTSLLSTEEYGSVDLFTTYIQLLLPLMTLLVEQGAFRYLIECKEDKEKKKIVTSSGSLIIIQCVIYAVIFVFIAPYIKNNYKFYVLGMLITAAFSGWSMQLARGFRKLTLYAAGSFITVLITICCNIVFIACFHMGATGMLLATCIGNIACTFFILCYLRIYRYCNYKDFNRCSIKEMICYSVPLIPNQLSLWVINSSDRTIVNYFLGAASNGILAISHKFSSIYQTVFGMFQLSWHEIGAIHFNDSDRDEFFTETFDIVYKFFSSMCVGLIAVIPFIFPLLIDDKYAQAYYTIPFYLLAVLCNIVIGLLGVIYVALKKTSEIAKSTIYAGVINIVVHILLINEFKLFAAAISTFVSYGCIMLYRLVDTKKYIDIRYNYGYFAVSFFVSTLLLIPYYCNSLLLRILGLIVACLCAIIVNRKIIRSIVKEICALIRR